MQVSVETVSNIERRVTIGVPADQVEGEVTKRLQDAAKKAKVNGFRQGKVPLKVVKQRFGDGIRQEVLGEVINRTYFEALQQEDIKAAGMPSIDMTKDVEGEDLEYVASVEVYPEIELVDFAKFEINKPVATIEEADIDKMIDNLRKQEGGFEAVERAAQEGDQVTIDFRGVKDGEAFEGGTAENQQLELGSGRMIPGFEDGIVGMKAGEEKVVPVTFPEDYHSEELKGATVEFTIKVHEVAEPKLPAMDDEFFKKFGVEEGGEPAFREEVKKNMERELKNAQKNQVKSQVLDALYEAQTVDVPKALVANEIDNMRKQMAQQFGAAAQNMDMSSLLPDSMFEEQAQKRVALGLIMGEVVQSQEIKADPAQVDSTIEDLASTYDDPQQVIQFYKTNEQARASVEAMVMEEQAIEHILSSAKIKEEKTTYEELAKQQQQQQQ